MKRQKTWARELGLVLITIATSMTGYMVWLGDPSAGAVISTFLVSTFGFLTAAFVKAGWEQREVAKINADLEAQLAPEEAPDPIPPKGYAE